MKASIIACLAAAVSALPSPQPNSNAVKRQANPEAAAGLTDLDILNLYVKRTA